MHHALDSLNVLWCEPDESADAVMRKRSVGDAALDPLGADPENLGELWAGFNLERFLQFGTAIKERERTIIAGGNAEAIAHGDEQCREIERGFGTEDREVGLSDGIRAAQSTPMVTS